MCHFHRDREGLGRKRECGQKRERDMWPNWTTTVPRSHQFIDRLDAQVKVEHSKCEDTPSSKSCCGQQKHICCLHVRQSQTDVLRQTMVECMSHAALLLTHINKLCLCLFQACRTHCEKEKERDQGPVVEFFDSSDCTSEHYTSHPLPLYSGPGFALLFKHQDVVVQIMKPIPGNIINMCFNMQK